MLTSKVYGAALGITVLKRLTTSQARMKLRRRAIWLCLLFVSCIIGHVCWPFVSLNEVKVMGILVKQ
jgi:predicted acyltransferase